MVIVDVCVCEIVGVYTSLLPASNRHGLKTLLGKVIAEMRSDMQTILTLHSAEVRIWRASNGECNFIR